MGEPSGSVATALRNTRLISSILIVLIGVCSILIGLGKLSVGWLLTAQVISAIAGAALGNFLRLDLSTHVVRNQAKPATRHLFDRVRRLRTAVVAAESYQAKVKELEGLQVPLDHGRIADWFGFLGDGMRGEIDATATAIQNWGDLAKDVVDAEVESYNSRNSQLPAQEVKEEFE